MRDFGGNFASKQLETGQVLYQCHNCGRIIKERHARSSLLEIPLYSCPWPCHREAVLVLRGGQWNGVREPCEGVTVVKDFVSPEEEKGIVAEIDKQKWVESQSGRLKQDYGPKVNFKRQKLKLGLFNGLPSFSRTLVERMQQTVPQLHDFTPVEQCHLDYNPARGSAIDPHLDDSWVWGERLVTINLLSSTVLTFSSPTKKTHLHVPQPRGSLVVVWGVARYSWLHSISRHHVSQRRVGITLRELSSHFRVEGNQNDIGAEILGIAGNFNGTPSNSLTLQHLP